MIKYILLNDFRYPEDSAIAIEKSMSQIMRLDSTRSNSKRVKKFSLQNESVLKDKIPSPIIPSYRVSPDTNKKGGQRVNITEGPTDLEIQNHFILLKLPSS